MMSICKSLNAIRGRDPVDVGVRKKQSFDLDCCMNHHPRSKKGPVDV